MQVWKARKSGPFAGVTADPETTHVLYESTCASTRRAVQEYLVDKPLSEGVKMMKFAAFALEGVAVDRVGIEEEEDVEIPDQADALPEEAEGAAPAPLALVVLRPMRLSWGSPRCHCPNVCLHLGRRP